MRFSCAMESLLLAASNRDPILLSRVARPSKSAARTTLALSVVARSARTELARADVGDYLGMQARTRRRPQNSDTQLCYPKFHPPVPWVLKVSLPGGSIFTGTVQVCSTERCRPPSAAHGFTRVNGVRYNSTSRRGSKRRRRCKHNPQRRVKALK